MYRLYRFSFHRPLLALSLGLVSHCVNAALQPMTEAPLASDTELHCHFNRDASTDQNICAHFGNEISDCKITREPTAFVVHDGYTVRATLNDQRALEKLANDYVYTDESLKDRWDGFINYRRHGQQADLYLGNPETYEYSFTLTGGQMEKAVPGCQVHSLWYDLELEGKRTDDGLRYHYRLSQKTRWLSHSDVASEAFGKMIEDARACAEQVHQVVRL